MVIFGITPMAWVRVLRQRTLPERIRCLLSMAAQGTVAPIKARQTDIAAAVNSAREPVCRVLKGWATSGLLEVDRQGSTNGGATYTPTPAFYAAGDAHDA